MKKILVIAMIFVLLFCVTASAEIHLEQDQIPKVAETDISVTGMQKLGVLKGTPNGLELERPVTRAEAVTLIKRLMPVPVGFIPYTGVLSDMENHWAKEDVSLAVSYGWVHGTTAGTFEPERTVTAQEFCKILLCAMGYDATLENAYDLGVSSTLLVNNYTKSTLKNNPPLSRGDCMRYLYASLLAKTSEGKMVMEVLTISGKYKAEDFRFMGSATPTAGNSSSMRFADNLNAQMPADKNYVFSPYSIRTALLLALNGASGNTETEIKNALGITNNQYNEVYVQATELYNAQEFFTLNTANSVWHNIDVAPGVAFKEDYVQNMQTYFGADVQSVNNQNAVSSVNGWVNEKTNGKIPTLIESPDFAAALVNAVYMNGKWQNDFSKTATQKDTFYGINGEQQADFMNDVAYYRYAAKDGITIVEMPYRAKDLEVSMYLLMADAPIENPAKTATDTLLHRTRLALSVPKFEMDFTAGNITEILKSMGISDAFSAEKANFSGMASGNPLFVQDVIHKAYIKVDEDGTEAAAATGMMMGATSMPPSDEPVPVKFDKPFTFVIMDKTNHQPLFVGAVRNVEDSPVTEIVIK